MKDYILLICFILPLVSKAEYNCNQTICNPRAGDLLIGRESLLRATSTCGLKKVESYCIVIASDRTEKPKCDFCNSQGKYSSENLYSHRIENVVSRLPRDEKRWWQSESGKNNVTIEIEFESEFQFIYTQLRFKTYRPASMYIERSNDYGKTWHKYAYFSDNCARDFPSVSTDRRNDINEVSCTSEFSSISPSEGGTVLFVASPGDFYIDPKLWNIKRNDVTAITNLRVVFVRLHTFGDLQIDNNENIRNKYYYALSEWIIRGRCSCYGHAAKCKPKEGQQQTDEMVYGVCECQHNTYGQHCENCKPFYNDSPWKPATRSSTNECRKCNCNDHATSCYFNSIYYQQSGNKTGGICDLCQHNTEGFHCEKCKSSYYRNNAVPITSPATCLKCRCNNKGSLHKNSCEKETVKSLGIVAGSCKCKENVDGYFCDTCKIGYWNFDAGCIKCKCKMEGTVGNIGCSIQTGFCICKLNVEGPTCSKCKEGYFNLSPTNTLGCTSCGCSIIGSYNYTKCDKNNGQCACKPGYNGRTCDIIKDGWFVEKPKHILQRNEIVITLRPVIKTGLYNFIITFDTDKMKTNEKHRISINIIHPSPSSCGVSVPLEMEIAKEDKYLVIPNKCLERDLFINIVVNVLDQGRSVSQLPAIVNIIVIPLIDPSSTKTKSLLKKCLNNNTQVEAKSCDFLAAEISSKLDPTSPPEKCNCDITGSNGVKCEKIGGQCECLPNVSGRKCDQCSINSYGFGAMGCSNCDCNSQGSLSLQCNKYTGACICQNNVEGKKCTSCKPGFWNFPHCQKCECNSHSDRCDQITGKCIDCKSQTFGKNCDQCNKGYYGDPERQIPCLPCKCPGLDSKIDNSFGCKLQFNTSLMVCLCKKGFSGRMCDKCYENYFGNAKDVNVGCKPCICSNNTDITQHGTCDTSTGECLKCLYSTTGFNCEKCKVGYFGDGSLRTCKKCSCNDLGTDKSTEDICNIASGQCKCLNNVVGFNCDKCQINHFNLTSGSGCEPCNCNYPIGSKNNSCDEITGQCFCVNGRSGRKCDQCEKNFWGNPEVKGGCKECKCNTEGSLTQQCKRDDGKCSCKPGVTGSYCDRCDKGTSGVLPNCIPCGECWDYWDKTLTKLNNSMVNLVNIKMINRFANHSENIKDLKNQFDILTNMSSLPDDITGVNNKFKTVLKKNLSKSDFQNDLESIKRKFETLSLQANEIEKTIKEKLVINPTITFDKILEIKNWFTKKLDILNSSIFTLNYNDLIAFNNDLKVDIKVFKEKKMFSQEKFNSLNETISQFREFVCKDIECSIDCKTNCTEKVCLANTQKICMGNQLIFYKLISRIKKEINDIEDNFENPGIASTILKDLSNEYNNSKTTIDNIINTMKNFQILEDKINELKKLPGESLTLEEFKKLLTNITHFQIQENQKTQINELRRKIEEKRNLLSNVEKILEKSKQNRLECKTLKDKVSDLKSKTNSIIKLIEDLPKNDQEAKDNQKTTKNLLNNNSSNIAAEVLNIADKKLEPIQTETNNIIKQINTINDKIKEDQKSIFANIKKFSDSLDINVDLLAKKLNNKKKTLTKIKKELDNLKSVQTQKQKELNDFQEKLRSKISNIRQEALKMNDNLTKQNSSIEEKKQKIKELESSIEIKLNKLSIIQKSIYKKSNFQQSCIPV